MTFSDVLDSAIGTALPELGDFGFFDVIAGEHLCRSARAYEDEELELALRRVEWERPLEASCDSRFSCTGKAALHLNSEKICLHGNVDGGHPAAPSGVAFNSMMQVPMRYRGELIGALTLYMGKSRRLHTLEQFELAQELASLTAPIVMNAQLVEQHSRAREALQKSEEFLRSATEAAELGLWEWDILNDRITCSDRLFELHGLPPRSSAAPSAEFVALVHPDDLPAVLASRDAALAGTGDYIVEFRPLRADGQISWLSARAQVMRDSAGRPLRLVGATIDVTQRVELLAAERRARCEAEKGRERLELLATASIRLSGSLQPDSTLLTIAEVIVPRLADWCRIDLLDGKGVLVHALTHHSDAERAKAATKIAQRMRASPQAVGSLAWCVATGRSHRNNFASLDELAAIGDPEMLAFAQTVSLRAYCVTPLVARGRRIGAMAMLQAESGRCIGDDDAAMIAVLAQRAAVALDNARLYTEAEEARREAEQARQKAEDADRAKDAFLAMLGHELRNPLAPIVATLKVMALRDSTSFRDERRVIERQVMNLSHLVDDLLDVARITRGQIHLKRELVTLQSVIHRAVETATPLLEKHRHNLEITLPDAGHDDAAPVFDADESRLVQVFANLLTNAARYTPEGGHIRVQAQVNGIHCRIGIHDDGQGIPSEILPHVFELFFQGAQGPDRAAGGMGIGLALVKNIVGLHGGRVEALSEGPDRGSSFIVELPLAAPAQLSAATSLSTTEMTPETRRKRILLVDDNRDALESLAMMLELHGHEVRIASDPVTGLTLAAGFDPEVAILDIGLPGMDGYELANRLRANGATCRLFALTGYGLAQDREKSRACGFDHHLVKPIDPAVLIQALD